MKFFGEDTQTVNKINPYSDYQQQGLKELYGQTAASKEKTAADYNNSEMGNQFEGIMQNARNVANRSYGDNGMAIAQKYKQPGSYGMAANYANANQLAQDLYGAESNARLQKAQYMDAYNRQGQSMADAYNQNRVANLLGMLNAQPNEIQIDQQHKAGFMDYLNPVLDIGAKAAVIAMMAHGMHPMASTTKNALVDPMMNNRASSGASSDVRY